MNSYFNNKKCTKIEIKGIVINTNNAIAMDCYYRLPPYHTFCLCQHMIEGLGLSTPEVTTQYPNLTRAHAYMAEPYVRVSIIQLLFDTWEDDHSTQILAIGEFHPET